MWTRTRQRLGATASALRAGVSFLRLPDAEATAIAGPRRDHFGKDSAVTLTATVTELARDAAVGRMALGPVEAVWTAETTRLDRQLALLPLAVETEVVTDAGRRTLRRTLGAASLYVVEILIVSVLLIAAVRVGIDFVTGAYAPGSLFLTAMELIFILLLIGHITAALFFPPLQKRLRRRVGQRAKTLIRICLDRLQIDLREHVDAVDRLSREGRDLLQAIERTMMALATAKSGAGVDRLFGQEEPAAQRIPEAAVPATSPDVKTAEPARRRPRFD
jgi:hypothetical protein